jgi:hypothetical protein
MTCQADKEAIIDDQLLQRLRASANDFALPPAVLERIDQMCLERSAGFAPVNLPLFHGPYQAGRTNSGRISWRAMAPANSDKILNSPVPTTARLGMLTVALALNTAS